ncbi:protein phosphatase 1 regulatory subunit 3C-B-like [Aplochiton taeniatus]
MSTIPPRHSVLPMFGVHQSAGLMDMALNMCFKHTHMCPYLWVPTLKPQRPCIRPPLQEELPPGNLTPKPLSTLGRLCKPADKGDDSRKGRCEKKRVVFADSKGLPLTAVRIISEPEEHWRGKRTSPRRLQEFDAMPRGWHNCNVSTSCPGTRLQLGFPQPSADFQVFRTRLAESMVLLENCCMTETNLQGTVRVRNVGFQKDVFVRVTFDSWRRHRDVPCSYLQKRYGGPETDIFIFDITFPKALDVKEKIEFCVGYVPGGQSTSHWDNNNGHNYSVFVCASTHLPIPQLWDGA